MKRQFIVTSLTADTDGLRRATRVTATNYANESVTFLVKEGGDEFAMFDIVAVTVELADEEEEE